MPEALARVRREPTLSVPVREAAPRKAKAAAVASRKFGLLRLLPKTLGGYVAIAFCGSLLGVVVNAVVLQHERHPAPLFHSDPPATTPAAAVAAPTAAPSPDPQPAPAAATQSSRLDEAPTPIARPPATAAAPPKKADSIGDLLRNGGASDGGKDLAVAQHALIKLGYTLDADGVMGADTLRALHEFEKSHSLPVSSEITPRLLAKLNAAAAR